MKTALILGVLFVAMVALFVKGQALVNLIRRLVIRHGGWSAVGMLLGTVVLLVGSVYAAYRLATVEWNADLIGLTALGGLISVSTAYAFNHWLRKDPVRLSAMPAFLASASLAAVIGGSYALTASAAKGDANTLKYFVVVVASIFPSLAFGGWLKKSSYKPSGLQATMMGALVWVFVTTIGSVGVNFVDVNKYFGTPNTAANTGDTTGGTDNGAGGSTSDADKDKTADPAAVAAAAKPKFVLDVRGDFQKIESEMLTRTKDMTEQLLKLIPEFQKASDALSKAESEGYLRPPGGQYGKRKVDSDKKERFQAYDDFAWLNGLRGATPHLRLIDVETIKAEVIPSFETRMATGQTTEGERNQLIAIHDSLGRSLGFQTFNGTLPKGFSAPDELVWTFAMRVAKMKELVAKVEAHRKEWDALPD